jgi:hypothetical protein
MRALFNPSDGSNEHRVRTRTRKTSSVSLVSDSETHTERSCPLCCNRLNRTHLKLALRLALARKYNLNPNLKYKKVVHELLFRPKSATAILFHDQTFYNKPVEGMRFIAKLEVDLRLTRLILDGWSPVPKIKNYAQRKVVKSWAKAQKALKQENFQKKQKKAE